MNDLAVVGLEWLGGVTIFLGFILLLRYLEHRERMTMIEHGLWQPDANQPPRYPRGSAQLRGGLITAGVGFALTIGLYNLGWLLPAPLTAAPGRIGPWLLPGLIPLAVGVALIIGYYLSPPNQESHAHKTNTTEKRSGLHIVQQTERGGNDTLGARASSVENEDYEGYGDMEAMSGRNAQDERSLHSDDTASSSL